MEIKLKIIFVIYTGLFCSAVCHRIRHIQYSPGNRQFSTKDKDCCVRFDENEYKAVKIPLGNESKICYGLDRDWLLDKHYDDGYYYIEKEKVVEIFKPPIPMSINGYYWTLPISFEAGAIITIFFTSPISWTRLNINIYESMKDDLPPNPPHSKPVMHHLYFRYDNDVGVDTFTPDQGWHDKKTRPCPVELGKTYNITLESHTGFIRTVIDGHPYFDVPHMIPPMNAATVEIEQHVSAPFLMHNITMNGRVKKRFTSFT